MKLKVVTFTGADDSVRPEQLIEVQKKFPDIKIEWGILFSKDRQGSDRYPSAEWISTLKGKGLKLAAHLCGYYVKEIGRLRGMSDTHVPEWMQAFPESQEFRTIQINSGNNPPSGFLETEYKRSLWHLQDRNIIVQSDGSNMGHFHMLQGYGFNVSVLHDKSGGKGKSESFIKPEFQSAEWGFAGGISPENVVEKILNIMEVYNSPFWIDMESGIRTEKEGKSVFDIKKVESVLSQIQELRKDLKEFY